MEVTHVMASHLRIPLDGFTNMLNPYGGCGCGQQAAPMVRAVRTVTSGSPQRDRLAQDLGGIELRLR
jgi:hypothetical protein